MPFSIKPAGLLLALTLAVPVHAQHAYAPTQIGNEAGSVTAIAHWQMQDSAKAQEDGAEISSAAFSATDWYPVSGRATVMAGLLENGKYPDVFHSDNLRAVQVPDASGQQFVTPWWYRSQFTLVALAPGQHILLRTHGLIASADVWVNGHQVADHAALAGAYPVHEFDVTALLHAGSNVLALRAHPADVRKSLAIGWVDWNPTPPDDNMGPWRGVDIVRSGPVELRWPHVRTVLALPSLARAALNVSVEARNLDAVAHAVTVNAEVAGVHLQRTITLAPHQTQQVVFAPATDAGLELAHPKVWWPVGMGAHPLHDLSMQATVDGAVSSRSETRFGIRSVSSRLTRQGYRQFLINGRPLLIRGAGWAPDLFLRDDPARMAAEFSYIENLGLNTIRSEGKLEDERFYTLADRAGIMVLAGWECCDKWESAAKTGGEPWNAADVQTAKDSMASEARLLRNHPAVIGFLIGSDNAPPPAIATMYVDTLHDAGWDTPIIAAASAQATAQTGPSGMKMAGPYAWVPPAYWYADQLGGAFGFDSEVSAGADIPRLEDLRSMLSPQEQEALWKYPEVRQYHASAAWSPFASLLPFDTALAKRYGAPGSLADYAAKAQLDNYDSTRAQFEAFNAHMDRANPSTGVIYWMLNNAWPSLHWHLYDWYMNPAGAYFGAKKANEPLHIQYDYATHGVVAVNLTAAAARDLTAHVRVRNLDGSVRFDKTARDITLAGNHAQSLLALPALAGLSDTYFVELELGDAGGKSLSRNVYWLAMRTDAFDWAHSNWYLTPLTRYADFTALQTAPVATSTVRASLHHEGEAAVATVTLSLPATARGVALFQHLSIRQATGGALALPIVWSDNDVTLWPGESVTLTARFKASGAAPVLEVDGWKQPARSISFGVDGQASAATH